MDGAPGPKYWQQRADYEIECRLDVEKLQLHGDEQITYYNQSPSPLSYLWLQLDENEHSADADNNFFDPSSINRFMSESQLRQLLEVDLPALEAQMEAAGVPWTPGRPLPDVR